MAYSAAVFIQLLEDEPRPPALFDLSQSRRAVGHGPLHFNLRPPQPPFFPSANEGSLQFNAQEQP
jgi:hypothetical protein